MKTTPTQTEAFANTKPQWKSWLGATLEVPVAVSWAGILSILAVGLIHAIAMPGSLEEGMRGEAFMFAANALGALVATVAMTKRLVVGWILGALVAGGALAGFLMSRTMGMPNSVMMMKPMPGMMREEWLEPLALTAISAELLFVSVLVWAFATHRAHRAGRDANEVRGAAKTPVALPLPGSSPAHWAWSLAVAAILGGGVALAWHFSTESKGHDDSAPAKHGSEKPEAKAKPMASPTPKATSDPMTNMKGMPGM